MSNEQPALIEGIPAGITARHLEQTPVADWLCACGVHERARGRHDAQQLLARARVGRCPHREAS